MAISEPPACRLPTLTFDGHVPGPELRVRQGDLVEVTILNRDVDTGVSIHWHGVDVPNAEDGVSGVTQNAVPPGGRHVYRFRVDQVGTFWYHTHQASAREVKRGLFGAFVVEPRQSQPPRSLDMPNRPMRRRCAQCCAAILTALAALTTIAATAAEQTGAVQRTL